MESRAKSLFLIGFVSAFSAYSFSHFMWHHAFYHLTALSFVGYLGALYYQTTGVWSLIVLVAFMSAINALFDEVFFDPLTFDVNEYIGFASIITVVLLQRKKWRR